MERMISSLIETWASETESVEALFATGPRENPAAVKRDSDPYDYIVVLTHGEEVFAEADWAGVLGQEVLQAGLVSGDATPAFRIFLADGTRINFLLADPSKIETVLTTDSLARAVYDPHQLFADRKASTDLSRRMKPPKPEEFARFYQAFFMHMSDVAAALMDDELLVAQVRLEKARRILRTVTMAAVASKSGFRINLGPEGVNLKAYMNEVAYDHLVRSYAQTDELRIWDAVFQACMLFRKSGLALHESENLAYPKELDVRMMQYLRHCWEERRR